MADQLCGFRQKGLLSRLYIESPSCHATPAASHDTGRHCCKSRSTPFVSVTIEKFCTMHSMVCSCVYPYILVQHQVSCWFIQHHLVFDSCRFISLIRLFHEAVCSSILHTMLLLDLQLCITLCYNPLLSSQSVEGKGK